MKHALALPVLIFSFLSLSSAQESAYYDEAYEALKQMLEDTKNTSFERAVFLVENAYFDGKLRYNEYQRTLNVLANVAQRISEDIDVNYHEKDSLEVKRSAALFRLMTDTTTIVFPTDTLQHLPYTYHFDDPFGEHDWQNTFVTQLLVTKAGNCHSMPYLYKILAERIGINASLALSPNHIYIKQRCEGTGWYNTELTSGSFPIDAWIMASGYVPLEAIRNGVFMKPLSETESIVLCIIDLALGYDRFFPENDGTFILDCCSLALKYFPDYITALILKAETLQRVIRQKDQPIASANEENALQSERDADAAVLWEEMQETYKTIHRLGYRQMPKEMYLNWLASLQTEQVKYRNKSVPRG